MLKTRASGQKWPTLVQCWPIMAIFEFSPKKRNSHFFRLQRLGFVQKIREFQCAVFEKMLFLRILFQNGPKMDHFRIFGEKVKTSPSYPFFLFFKTKNQKIPMCGFGENLTDGNDGRETDRQTETRANL